MKKILVIAIVLLTATAVNAQQKEVPELDYDSVVGNSNGLATVYLNNGVVLNIRAIINPGALGLESGKLESRQAIILNPAYKPGGWDKMPDGSYQPVDFLPNPGYQQTPFDFQGPVLIVEANLNPKTGKTEFWPRLQNVSWRGAPNPAATIRMYKCKDGESVLPKGFVIPPVNITKNIDGTYTLGVR